MAENSSEPIGATSKLRLKSQKVKPRLTIAVGIQNKGDPESFTPPRVAIKTM
jgi:hypothetical protein